MATQMTFMEALAYFKEKMDAVIKDGDGAAVKAADYADNKLKLYLNADMSGTPLEVDLPEEMFLDQAKTTLVSSFAWSETEYPGSTDPNLDGKPVMVLAVKGDAGDTYSFVSFESLTTETTGATEATALVGSDGTRLVLYGTTQMLVSPEGSYLGFVNLKDDGTIYIQNFNGNQTISVSPSNILIQTSDGLKISMTNGLLEIDPVVSTTGYYRVNFGGNETFVIPATFHGALEFKSDGLYYDGKKLAFETETTN